VNVYPAKKGLAALLIAKRDVTTPFKVLRSRRLLAELVRRIVIYRNAKTLVKPFNSITLKMAACYNNSVGIRIV